MNVRPTHRDAAVRRLVRLDDGREGRITYCPLPDGWHRARPTNESGRRRSSTKATVLVGQRHVRISPERLTVLDPDPGCMVAVEPKHRPDARPLIGVFVGGDEKSVTVAAGGSDRKLPRSIIGRIDPVTAPPTEPAR